ncbi:Transcriptional regulator, LacI family [Modestobacter italicus]|uniref:Transcriptional regulator, LacI family n=1 Tax=Modestobacter italicus (strain DSM 44449 / CECT 9708 / BC 501) TaxID=2732864 RepID=I4F5C8_MODI5|nr:substrate-binding domain-containing protein [Modestobacter marinus]CCH90841.1 Transcriptional regulator, LacI family [Modestobacter marinus]
MLRAAGGRLPGGGRRRRAAGARRRRRLRHRQRPGGAAEALRRWPDTDAVYGICDEVALGALQVLRAAGRQVPGDVAVAGFDDIPAAEPTGLTTATHPVERIAGAAARSLLVGGTGGPTYFGSDLVVRQSA